MSSKFPIAQVVTMGVLVVGLGFGVWQVKQSQDIKRSKASYCGVCSPNGTCECADSKQTGNKCKYAPPECSNLGNTWQPDSSCTANAACEGGEDGGGSTPTPTPTSTSWNCAGRSPQPPNYCLNCGGLNQGYCGKDVNTCNCNTDNAPCKRGLTPRAGKCVYWYDRSGPTPTPTPYKRR